MSPAAACRGTSNPALAVLPRLVPGGGFNGKSTLLEALAAGMYDHVPGDGREFVCIDPTAVQVSKQIP